MIQGCYKDGTYVYMYFEFKPGGFLLPKKKKNLLALFFGYGTRRCETFNNTYNVSGRSASHFQSIVIVREGK